jgi:trans-aconitate 2-methyltransferase
VLDAPVISAPLASMGRRVRFRHVAHALQGREPASVLDAGCGDGRFTAWIADRFPSAAVTGMDSEPALVAAARARYPTLDLNVGEIGSSVLEGRRFDVIVCTDVLEHIADDRAAFAWLAERLAPGGRLVLHVPADDQRHFRSISEGLRREVALGEGPHLREGYSAEELARLAAGAGLSTVSVASTFVGLPVRLAVDVETWISTHGVRALKLVLLPVLMAAVATERRPHAGRHGNGRLLIAEADGR